VPNLSRLKWFTRAVIVFQATLCIAWIIVDRIPPYWDEAWYMLQGMEQLQALKSGGLTAWYQTWVGLERIRPGFVPTLLVPLYALFGLGDDVGLIVNVLALCALLYATYRLGEVMSGPMAGILSAMTLASYPIVVGLSHILLVEMTMMALVALSMLALWKSDGFRNRRLSLLFGLCLGLGLMCKVFYVVFVVGPLAVVALGPCLTRDGRSLMPWRRLLNLALALAVAACVVAPWYVPNLRILIGRSIDAAVGQEAGPYGPQDPLSWSNLVGYSVRFIGTSISLAGGLLFVAGTALLAISLTRRSASSLAEKRATVLQITYLGSCIIVGYCLFSCINNQDPKHVTGILPAFACLSGLGLSRLRAWAGKAALVVVALVMVCQSLLATFPGPLSGLAPSVSVLGHRLVLVYPAPPGIRSCRYAAPDGRPWPLEEILEYALDVADLEQLPSHKARVGILPSTMCFEGTAFSLVAEREEMPLWLDHANSDNMDQMDVIIHKTGFLSWESDAPPISDAIARLGDDDSQYHLMPCTFALPDGSLGLVYARAGSPLMSQRPEPQTVTDVTFGGAARLLGCDIEAQLEKQDMADVSVTFYWECVGATNDPCRVFVHWLDPDTGQLLAQDDHLLFPLVYPTNRWQKGHRLTETRVNTIPVDKAQRGVTLRIGLYDDRGRLPVTDGSDWAGPDYCDVATISFEQNSLGAIFGH